jgi:hypothetical protein
MLQLIWLACAVIIITAAVRSRRDPHWLRVGRYAVAFLYLVAGAAVNALFLARGDDYASFADGASLTFVSDTWRSLVVPHHEVFISLLVVFELAVGVLVLLAGKRTQLGYAAAIAFHVALLFFGWGFLLWVAPMTVALATLLRGELRGARQADAAVAACVAADSPSTPKRSLAEK